MDAMGDFPQVVDHAHELRGDAGDLGTELGPSGIWLRRRAQPERQRHEPLLCAVVQVALDPPADLIRGGDDPRTRGDQLGPALRVRHRGRDQLGELRHPLLGVGRQRRLPGPHGDHPPQLAVDVYRQGDRGQYPLTKTHLRAWNVAVVIDPGGPAGPPDRDGQPGRRVVLPALADPHV